MRYSKAEIEQAIKDKTWPQPAMICEQCDQILQSMFPGHFVMCGCGESFVDQTPHYSRQGGKVKPFSLKKEGK